MLYGAGCNRYKYDHHSPLHHEIDDIKFIKYYYSYWILQIKIPDMTVLISIDV